MKKAALGNARLKITLFRSLLRWTRTPEAVQTKFSLDPSEFGVDDLLPSSVRRIRNHTGVYGAISYLFRRVARGKAALSDHETVDVAMDVIKRLNQLGAQLKVSYSSLWISCCRKPFVRYPELIHFSQCVRCHVMYVLYRSLSQERLNQRIKNSAWEVHSKAVYRVGTTLHHLPTGARCVVIGWDVDLATGQQRYVLVCRTVAL